MRDCSSLRSTGATVAVSATPSACHACRPPNSTPRHVAPRHQRNVPCRPVSDTPWHAADWLPGHTPVPAPDHRRHVSRPSVGEGALCGTPRFGCRAIPRCPLPTTGVTSHALPSAKEHFVARHGSGAGPHPGARPRPPASGPTPIRPLHPQTKIPSFGGIVKQSARSHQNSRSSRLDLTRHDLFHFVSPTALRSPTGLSTARPRC